MNFKKMKRWVKIVFGLFFVFSVVGLFGVFGLMLYLAFTDDQVVTNTAIMNRIAIILGGLSLPGLMVQFISFLTINEKKTYTLTTKCPNCKHLVDFKLTED
ncbi:hypothetical protein ACM1RC_26020 [Paenibacillus azoreducens]|uniref:hypothetical protein n=1 Tax=Paenibacillus azoreducens TaxID=116718 RepID=UPI0039F537BE